MCGFARSIPIGCARKPIIERSRISQSADSAKSPQLCVIGQSDLKLDVA